MLIVEVADTSLALDRLRKGGLYARAGIADYWVVNLIDEVLEVYRDPVPDPSGRGGFRYDSVRLLRRNASVDTARRTQSADPHRGAAALVGVRGPCTGEVSR